MVNGKKITVGSGMDDSERDNPCEIGEFITVKYFELTSKNQVPRFPVYLGKLHDKNFQVVRYQEVKIILLNKKFIK